MDNLGLGLRVVGLGLGFESHWIYQTKVRLEFVSQFLPFLHNKMATKKATPSPIAPP